MKRASNRFSFLIAMFALASFPASMGAQPQNPIATKAANQSVEALLAGPAASETERCKSGTSKGQPILQPGTLREPGQAPIKLWGMPMIPTDTQSANRRSWIGAGPGSLLLGVAGQPDVIQKYGTNPGILQVYFGRRP